MPKALDISNYTGKLTLEQARWIAERYDLVVVRLSTEDNRAQREIASQQVAVLATNGIPWQGYLWVYWHEWPGALWMLAKQQLPDNWPGYTGSGIWLDLEDMPPDPELAKCSLQAYIDILETEGFTPGIYSGSWWVAQNGWVSDEPIARKLARLPTWWAHYGVEPTCNLSLAGPFQNLAMHQYTSHNSLGPLMACDESLICSII